VKGLHRTLLPFLCSLALHAVPLPFSLVLEGPYDEALCDLSEDPDGRITAVGHARSYRTGTAEPKTYDDPFAYLEERRQSEGEVLRLLRLDADGAVTFERRLNIIGFHRAVSLLPTPSGGYLLGGYTRHGRLFVAGLGRTGDVQFIRRFGTANFDRMRRLLPLRDGGVLAVGSSFTVRDSHTDPFTQGLGGSDLYLTRLSGTGRILWSRKYGTTGDDRGIAAAEAADGSLVVAGMTDGESGSSPFFMRLTEHGEKIWTMPYRGKGPAEVHDLIVLKNGSFLASLSHAGAIRLLSFDLHRRLLDTWETAAGVGAALYSLAEYSNGSIIGVGCTADGKKGDSDALAVRFASGGSVLWKGHFGGPKRDLFRSVRVLRDGRAVAVGSYVPEAREVSDMWIAILPETAAPESGER
jgi:hypothetical protein